jgi:hypothetical protein
VVAAVPEPPAPVLELFLDDELQATTTTATNGIATNSDHFDLRMHSLLYG